MDPVVKKVVKKKLVIQKAVQPHVITPTQAQERYISQLTPQEQIVLKIAQEHLETSFDLERSIGYIQWLKTQKL
jgi:hypothetical protein